MNAFPIRFILSLLITGFSMFNLNAQNKNFGIFEGFTDVGPVKYEGAFAYDAEPQE